MTTATMRIPAAIAAPKSEHRGFFGRLYNAFIEARMRAAMRELRRHHHLIPEDTLRKAGYGATAADDSAYPFTR